MNLVAAIEAPHSLSMKNKIIRYVGTDKKRFRDLMNIFLKGTYRQVQWAGWPLSDIVRKHPEMVIPYLKPVLKSLDKKGMHTAVKRNVMRLLQFIDIPKGVAGLAFDKAFGLFMDTTEPIAVRVFSMQVMADIATKEPELKTEVILAIEEHLPYGSTALVNRGQRLLKKLKRG